MKENLIAEKTFAFSLTVIDLVLKLQIEKEYVLSKQLLRSRTSIGANVAEASAAQSKKDFIHKMSIASKEARETKYWLKILASSKLTQITVQEELTEIEHIVNIITKIIKSSQQSD